MQRTKLFRGLRIAVNLTGSLIAMTALVVCDSISTAQEVRGSKSLDRLAELALLVTHDATDHRARQCASEVTDVLKSAGPNDERTLEQAAILIQLIAKRKPAFASDAVPILVRLLPVTRSRAKCEIIRVLGAIQADASAAVPGLNALIEGTDDTHSEFYAIHAAASLARIAPRESETIVTKVLCQKLKDTRPSIRWIAADALGDAGIKSGVIHSALIACLDDSHVSVRTMAARALLKLGSNPDDKLIDVLANAIYGEGRVAYIKPMYLSEWKPTSATISIGTLVLVHDRLGGLPDRLKDAQLSRLLCDDFELRLDSFAVIEKIGANDPKTIAALQQLKERETSLLLHNKVTTLLSKRLSSDSN